MNTTDTIAAEKAQLRRRIAEQKMQHTESLERRSACCIQRFLALPQLSAARVVLLYHSLPDEVGTHPLADRLLAEGKTVLLPQVTGKVSMELRRYTGASSLQPGAYGIMEPTDSVWTRLEAVDLALVPGVAFDRAGHRLGRGRGYYDRMLVRMPQTVKVGICFDFQLVESVPVSPNDICMDVVVAESEG